MAPISWKCVPLVLTNLLDKTTSTCQRIIGWLPVEDSAILCAYTKGTWSVVDTLVFSLTFLPHLRLLLAHAWGCVTKELKLTIDILRTFLVDLAPSASRSISLIKLERCFTLWVFTKTTFTFIIVDAVIARRLVRNNHVRILDTSIQLMATEKIPSLWVGWVVSEEIPIWSLQKGPAVFEIYRERIINMVPIAENPILECLWVFAALESWTLLILWTYVIFEESL